MRKIGYFIPPLTSALLIFLWLYTALSKWSNLSLFHHTLLQSFLLRPFARPVSIGLPLVEIIAAGLLFFPSSRWLGYGVSASLLLLFTLYITVILLAGGPLPCSCGGFVQSLGWGEHLVFNLFCMLMTIAGWKYNRSLVHPTSLLQ